MRAHITAIVAVLATACGSSDAGKTPKATMSVHHEYDFLIAKRAPAGRRNEFGLGHRLGPDDAATSRAAIRTDSRPAVRAAALRLLAGRRVRERDR